MRKIRDEQVDLVMEIDRRKAIEMYERREKRRHEDQRAGAEIIKRQIEERERIRRREQEKRDLEQDAMMKHIERMREQDAKEAEERRIAAKYVFPFRFSVPLNTLMCLICMCSHFCVLCETLSVLNKVLSCSCFSFIYLFFCVCGDVILPPYSICSMCISLFHM